jgi:hypothetical protein
MSAATAPAKSLIEICCYGGAQGVTKKLVRARVFGKLALHASERRRGQLTSTHIPTGYAVMDVYRSESERLIKAFARLNWNFTDPYALPQRTKDGLRTIMDAFSAERTGKCD